MNTRRPQQTFSIRLGADDRAALEKAAQAEDRPVTSLARKIITDWLRRQPKEKRP